MGLGAGPRGGGAEAVAGLQERGVAKGKSKGEVKGGDR